MWLYTCENDQATYHCADSTIYDRTGRPVFHIDEDQVYSFDGNPVFWIPENYLYEHGTGRPMFYFETPYA
jgi:hypothetical protein